jgi:signal transduction histidine kinase
MKLLECRSLLLIPLVARGQTLGLLTLASRDPLRQYDGADLAVAQELAGRAAIALDNSRLYRESQNASRTKDEFLAMVSHELRTPINAVLGWAAMLREHRLDPSRAEYACDAIERSARAQAHMLEQLLDVSRAISGKLELHLAPAPLAGIVSAAVDAVRPEGDDKKVQITSRLDRSLPLMMVDPDRLQQVVVNLVSNAVKFSPGEGTVEVDVRQDDASAEIVVRDHGIGIRREFLPYVFERFRQAEGNRRKTNRGLGLGMSIARDIVERHGGTITAESAGEGKGATFTVRLPLRAPSDAGAPRGSTSDARTEVST